MAVKFVSWHGNDRGEYARDLRVPVEVVTAGQPPKLVTVEVSLVRDYVSGRLVVQLDAARDKAVLDYFEKRADPDYYKVSAERPPADLRHIAQVFRSADVFDFAYYLSQLHDVAELKQMHLMMMKARVNYQFVQLVAKRIGILEDTDRMLTQRQADMAPPQGAKK